MNTWSTRCKLAGIISAAIALILFLLDKFFHLTLYLFNRTSKIYITWLIVISIIAFTIYIYSSSKRNSTLLTGIIVILFLLARLYIYSPKFFKFESPYNDNAIVIEEDAIIQVSSHGTIYKMIHPLFITEIESYKSMDGFRPFTYYHYYLKWDENSVLLLHRYIAWSGDINDYNVVEIYFD